MNNSEKSALPTTPKASPDVKPKKSSYWLTDEEIAELHADAKRAEAILDALWEKRKAKESQKG